MPNESRKLSLEEEIFLKKTVDDAISDRVGGVMTRLKWFAWGLGAVLVLFIASGLLTKSNVLLEILGKATNFEGYMASVFEERIAVSYHNQFWLGTGHDEDQVTKLVFYAAPGQTAEMRIDASHVGPSDRLLIRVWLDENRDELVYESSDNGPFHANLEDQINYEEQGSRPDKNVHELHFEIVEAFEVVVESGSEVERPIEDRAFIAAMLNVYGREEK